MKSIFGLLIISSLIFIGTGCEENNDIPECIKGIVIAYEPCTGAVLVNVLDKDIGNQVEFNGSNFENVIRSPITTLKYSLGQMIYFNYRSFKTETDNALFNSDEPDPSCLQWSVDPLEVPTFVIAYSGDIDPLIWQTDPSGILVLKN